MTVCALYATRPLLLALLQAMVLRLLGRLCLPPPLPPLLLLLLLCLPVPLPLLLLLGLCLPVLLQMLLLLLLLLPCLPVLLALPAVLLNRRPRALAMGVVTLPKLLVGRKVRKRMAGASGMVSRLARQLAGWGACDCRCKQTERWMWCSRQGASVCLRLTHRADHARATACFLS